MYTDPKTSNMNADYWSSDSVKFVMIESPILARTLNAVETLEGFRNTVNEEVKKLCEEKENKELVGRGHWGLLNDYTKPEEARNKFPQWNKFTDVFHTLNWHGMNKNQVTKDLGLDDDSSPTKNRDYLQNLVFGPEK